jgi:uncharacterized coiled-coil protein SlyX
MNVLSDFEIRLKRWFPDTAEQDQIFKLGTQVIEKDMIIENQTEQIKKLEKKIARIKPVEKPKTKSAVKPETKTVVKKSAIPVEVPVTKASKKKVAKPNVGKTSVAKPVKAPGTPPVMKSKAKSPVAKANNKTNPVKPAVKPKKTTKTK